MGVRLLCQFVPLVEREHSNDHDQCDNETPLYESATLFIFVISGRGRFEFYHFRLPNTVQVSMSSANGSACTSRDGMSLSREQPDQPLFQGVARPTSPKRCAIDLVVESEKFKRLLCDFADLHEPVS